MIGAQILVREYNNFSDSYKSGLRTLLPDEVVTIKLNPSLWAAVKETQFASADATSPIAGRVNMVSQRTATRWLPSPWSVNDGGNIIQVGFFQSYNTVDNTPIWRDRFFENGDMIFRGDNPLDVQDFMSIQSHPELKKGEGSRGWKFYIDNPESNADTSLQKITWRTAIQNAVLGVSDEQLKKLSMPMIYGRSLFGKSTHTSSPKAMRGYIAGLLTNDMGYTIVEKVFRSLKEIEDIDLIIKALSTGKLIVSEYNLKRNDNHLLGSFSTPLSGTTEDKAVEIYSLFKSNPEWKQEILEWLKEEEKKTPLGAKKANKAEKLDEI